MCGRFTLTLEEKEIKLYLKTHYGIENPRIDNYQPRYNIAPSQQVLSIINDGQNYRSGYLKWGLVPNFARDESIGNKMINARKETLHEKPSFKHSFKSKRCVILASGFYEWKRIEEEKVPHHIFLRDEPIIRLAGLWSQLKKADGTNLFTCTIITTEANRFMERIHHRMPAILTREQERLWLDPTIQDTDTLGSLLTPYSGEDMDLRQVSSEVNFVRNDHQGLLNPR